MDNEHDDPDVIKERMAETRVSLTDKIETLESSLKETVENTLATATGAVENVTETVEQTVEAVKDTVEETTEAVKETVASSVEAVKSALDVRGHVRRHPWAMMAGAVALGFFGGRLIAGVQRRRQRRRAVGAYALGPTAMPAAAPAKAPPAARAPEPERKQESGSWLGSLGETFGAELNKLKGLALGATFGVLRDMVTASAPGQMRSQLSDVFNSVTSKLGGQPMREPLIDPAPEEPRGGYDGRRNETEMGRPVGAAHR